MAGCGSSLSFALAFPFPFPSSLSFDFDAGFTIGEGELLLLIGPRIVLDEDALGGLEGGVLALLVSCRTCLGGDGACKISSSDDEHRSMTAYSTLCFVLARVTRRVLRRGEGICAVDTCVDVFVTVDLVRLIMADT